MNENYQSENSSDSKKSIGLIPGFSKLTKEEKLKFICERFHQTPKEAEKILKSFWHEDSEVQKNLDEFSENTISNFPVPYGIVPNVLINGQNYFVPMAIEESSVVAAAAKASKFWFTRGGFKAKVVNTLKVGQVHFKWSGEKETLFNVFEESKEIIRDELTPVLESMEKRGGGLKDIELLDKTDVEENYFQLKATFETCDAMGANFINTVLENIGAQLKCIFDDLSYDGELEIIMAILSNYTPDCLVNVEVSCPVADLAEPSLGMSAEEFAEKFATAVRIACIDPYRATTHNKGIFNGIDAVVIATGNDFRAIEACGHSYAARDGQYRSLSKCEVENGYFTFSIDIPLALGTVGGLTTLHPLAKFSLDILGRPSSKELMEIVATIGLAQNFGAVRSLVTTGIQKGHMKMHLMNILNHLGATDEEREDAKIYFKDNIVSFSEVKKYLSDARDYQ